MKLFLTIIMILSLTSCKEASDFMYENFSLQKNIDLADEEGRKNIDGDFELEDFGYVFPPNVGRFIQNGFSYEASLEGSPKNGNLTDIPASHRANIYLKKGDNTIYVEAENRSSSDISIEDAPIDYIEISAFELPDMSFNLSGIEMGDALYEMKAQIPDKEIIELRQNSKDLQNDQYYMYLNGQYVVIFTLYQGKLSQIEIIPNERLSEYE